MLITDTHEIGSRLHEIRRKLGLTQSETAERAGLSDRTYADIERGTVNMRVDTLLKICSVFKITPNDILVNDVPRVSLNDIHSAIDSCPDDSLQTLLELINVYLKSAK